MSFVGVLVVIFLASGVEEARSSNASLEEVVLLALSPADERAVVRLPEGGLTRLEVGDEVPGTGATVRAVLPGRLVLEERLENASRTVWVYLGEAGTPGRLRYVEERPPTEKWARQPARSTTAGAADHE